jgi:hypothetical protein
MPGILTAPPTGLVARPGRGPPAVARRRAEEPAAEAPIGSRRFPVSQRTASPCRRAKLLRVRGVHALPMRRPHLLAAMLAALLGVLPAPAAAASPATSSRVGAGVRLLACDTAPAEADRAASFEGRMRATRAGQRLQMRFTLQISTPDAPRWRAVPAPGFGTWYSAGAGVTRWTYAKHVRDLLAPGSYRAVLRFRWRDSEGRIVARDAATSPVCRQPDLRPDLRSGTLTAAAADGAVRYVIPVRNAGRGPSTATRLTLGTGGSVLQATVPALLAQEEEAVTVTGPPCAAGSELVLVLDPDGRVEERSEEDNRRTLPCPAGAGG